MSKPRVFRAIPPDLRVRVQYGVDIAALDDVHDGDTINVWLYRERGDPGYTAIRIRDLWKHELRDPDPVRRQLAIDEQQELIALLAQHSLFTVHYQLTRTGQVVMSFTRAVAQIMLPDGRSVVDVLQPIRTARVQRLRRLGLYAPPKE